MGNPLHFIQASDTSAFAALHTEQGALPSQYEALQAYLKKIGLGRFGTLWAEPVTGQATPAGYASISWYTPLEGVGTPLSRLDAGEAEQARAALRRAREAVAPHLDDTPGGVLLRKALFIPSADNVFVVNGHPVLVNWGLLPQGMDEATAPILWGGPENGEAPTREWEQLQEQAERNRAYFQAHLAQNRLEIQRLAQQLQNTILLLQEDGSLRCRAGRVNPALAWRAPSLGDGRVFDRQQPNTLGDLVVDILLDASASQNRRQEQLATQGYILAEALTRCAIPVRVLSYCSVSGCTVLREYRDYRENQGNNRIFEFAAAGWNRDGLALRAVDWLLRRSGEQQRLLLILTDANPNDDTRLPGTGNQFFSRDYSGRPAVADAAEEATALRRHGNPPLCLFSGREGDLSSARTIYGRDVVRLPSVGWFAQTVGKIIQGRLQALES